MSFAIKVNVTENTALTELERMSAAFNLDRINRRIGTEEKLLFQNHFLKLPSNKMGFPSTGLYEQFAKSTQFQTHGDGVSITVNHGAARQRLEGGPIKPTGGKKYLTIPATAEAYGHRAGEFTNLRLSFYKKGGELRMFLGNPQGHIATEIAPKKSGKNKGKYKATASRTGLVPYFWLVKEVIQKPDRSILPTDEEIVQTALDATKAALAGGAL